MHLTEAVRVLFRSNGRATDGHRYTVPSPELYPFQWLWDSCFHAIVLSTFDTDAARAELRSAFSRPLPSGMLPHIIYWEHSSGEPAWGRELRGDIINAAWGTKGTSAITQPPLMAKAVHRVYEASGDLSFVREIYPALRAHHEYLARERTTDTGLVFIINPDESGEDNSPRFDRAQGLPTHHSADENLDRRILRMRENVACDFDARVCMAKRFAVLDVSFNVIHAEALAHLGALAALIGEPADAARYARMAKASREAIRTHLYADGRFLSYDLLQGAYIESDTWNLFMPLYGGLLTKAEASALVCGTLLDRERFWTPFAVPTVSRQDRAFDLSRDAFWRGPVWMAPNWFVYHGLKRYGFADTAQRLKESSIALIEHGGFREHYHPMTGEGLGARDFTWGGLVLDMR